MGLIADELQLDADRDLRHRLGSFFIFTTLVEDEPAMVRDLLAGCVVVRAEMVWHRQSIEYIAMHAEFDVCRPGDEPPRYRRLFTKHQDGRLTSAWQRA